MSEAFVPEWDLVVERWARKQARKIAWRLDGYELEDIVQEARLKFHQCATKYTGTVSEPQHFFALFRTAFWRHINNLTSRSREQVRLTEAKEVEDIPLQADNWVAEAFELLSFAPWEVRTLVGRISEDGAERPRRYRVPGAHRETTDERLSRLVRRDGAVMNIAEATRDFLTSGRGVTRLQGITEIEQWTIIRCTSRNFCGTQLAFRKRRVRLLRNSATAF